jgi:predicted flap endonuclease-1-like 5' DNA nuclease
MTPLIIALVSFAIALLAGVLLSKAYFTTQIIDLVSREDHHDLMTKQRDSFREQVRSLHNSATSKLASQKKTIDAQKREIHKLQLSTQDEASAKAFYDDKFVESLRVEISVIREHLNTRDDRIKEIEIELKESHVEKQKLLTDLNGWKKRVSPLTRKIHEQKELIDDIKEHEPREQRLVSESRTDDLKKIRGIGPALERRLNDSGIRSYQQIAEMSEREIKDVAERISISPAMVARGKWIQQARNLRESASPAEQRVN